LFLVVYLDNPRANADDTVEQAWQALVAKVRESGTLSSAVAMVDVSGSMSGLPMTVAIALGLLIAELTSGPFAGRVLTFASSPTWAVIKGNTLRDRVHCLAAAPWGSEKIRGCSHEAVINPALSTAKLSL
jgi:hypothetical protein